MRRRARIVVTAAVLAALAAPVALDRDGIPLSTYPMYAGDRGREIALVTSNALDADGARHRLSPRLIGRSDDPLVVAGELRAAVRADRADERCAEIAARLASSAGGTAAGGGGEDVATSGDGEGVSRSADGVSDEGEGDGGPAAGGADRRSAAVAVEVVTEVHDTVDRTSGRASLRRRTVHATCEVPRS